MSDTLTRIKNDLTEALKAGDTAKALALRYLLAEIHNAEITKGKDAVLTEEELAAVLQKQVKQRQESVESYRQGNREDLVKKEQGELEMIRSYLPEQMGEEDVKKIVIETIGQVGASSPADMGKVMGAVMPKVAGRADGSLVSKIVHELLTS